MAQVTEEDIVEVFGRVAPDYSDIPPETWRQVVSSLYGMEKREFDAFVDELEGQSKEGGTPDVRRSLVEIYDNAKRQVGETPEAAGRSEEEITAATNRAFSNIRRVVRDPSSLREVREKGLVQWSRENAGSSVDWSGPRRTSPMTAAEAMGARGLYGDPVAMGRPLEEIAVRDFMGTGIAEEEAFFAEAPPLGVEVAGTGEPALPGTGTYRGREAARLEEFGRSAPGLTPDQWDMLSPQQQRRYRSMSQSVGIEGAIGQGYVDGSTPSFSDYPGGAPAATPEVTATETAVVSTPAGTEDITASVTQPALPAGAVVGADGVPEMLRRPPASGGGASVLQGPGGTPPPGAAPAQPDGGGMSPMSLGGALIGGAGIAAAIGNTIADFRTTAALEDQLASSAAGDTIARREGALAGAQAQRNIMATSLGRRDISPALALRNAQMAGSRTLADVYGQAAIASARERRESEAQLAQLRKQRWNSLFGGLTRTAGDVGALLATQGAAEETANMNKRLTDLESANLNQVGLAPGQRRR